MSKKFGDFPKTNVSSIKTSIEPGLSTFSKWVPLICAGAAVGVSILALKEIKNVRKELMVLKKENVITGNTDPGLSEKVDRMDEQLRKITEYLVKNKEKPKDVLKEVIKTEPKDVKIINNDEEEVEYEEVTDDED